MVVWWFRLLVVCALVGAASPAVALEYERAGWEAELSTLFHGVSGTVRIVDEFTLEVENFTYDGGGIAVFFWLDDPDSPGPDPDYAIGTPIGSNLVGMQFNGDSFQIDTGNESLDGHDGISVWCTLAKVSFGDGAFQPVPEPRGLLLQAAALASLFGIARVRRARRRV